MRKRLFIWFLLPVVFLASCSLIYDQPDTEGCPELSIAIEFPENFASQTRSTVGVVPADEDENAIHDLSIWVFYSTEEGIHAHEKVGSIFVSEKRDLPSAGGVRKYALRVDKAFMLERPKVDVFVLANRGSIVSEENDKSVLTTSSTYDEVNDAFFGGEDAFFSPNERVTEVSAKGLPMSGVGKGLTVGGEEPFLKVPTISLGRAVSKVRFVFSQMYTEKSTEESTESEVFAIKEVVLNGAQIPMYEYVFSSGSTRIKSDEGYVSSDLEVLWPTGVELNSSTTPEIYSYAGQDGPSYEQLIKDGIKNNHLSHLGTFYLRESDKCLTGTVYYSITKDNKTEDKDLPFSMDKAGDFARNHTWTVYGYFISNRTLQLGVSALPWDKNNYTIKFSDESLQVTQKFTVDPASATVVRIGNTNEYNVFLDSNKPAKGYIYVTTPQGGTLHVKRVGNAADIAAFKVTPESATIDPSTNSGRIEFEIDRKESGITGKTITLSFEAFTPDERKISGESECIDQIYHFII